LEKVSSHFLTADEFARMETLLGNLLIGATDREQRLILQIHKRLKDIKETQQSDKTTLDYLQSLAS